MHVCLVEGAAQRQCNPMLPHAHTRCGMTWHDTDAYETCCSRWACASRPHCTGGGRLYAIGASIRRHVATHRWVHVVHTILDESIESGASKVAKFDQNRVPFWHGQFASSIRACGQCAATAQSASHFSARSPKRGRQDAFLMEIFTRLHDCRGSYLAELVDIVFSNDHGTAAHGIVRDICHDCIRATVSFRWRLGVTIPNIVSARAAPAGVMQESHSHSSTTGSHLPIRAITAAKTPETMSARSTLRLPSCTR
jgi:hypothetical protein